MDSGAADVMDTETEWDAGTVGQAGRAHGATSCQAGVRPVPPAGPTETGEGGTEGGTVRMAGMLSLFIKVIGCLNGGGGVRQTSVPVSSTLFFYLYVFVLFYNLIFQRRP